MKTPKEIKKSDFEILEEIHQRLKKSAINKQLLDELRKDVEVLQKTGKIWEPDPEELAGKTSEELIDLFRKNRPHL